MKFFSVLGIVFLILGGVFSFIGYSMLEDSGSTLKIFFAGPALALAGLGMMIFPGSITSDQVKNKEIDPKDALGKVPLKNKIIWGAFGLAGFIIANFFVDL